MKTEIIEHIESLGLSWTVNEKDDILIENKLALHFVDFFTETEPLKRWQYYYDKEIRCVFIYPTYNIKIYKNIIAYHFGKVQKIFARKCEFRIVKPTTIKSFFEENNIEGYRSASKAYCLYYNNELVMTYSVGHAFFGKGKYDLEIARGACKMGYQIVGGASKLWKHIIADNPLAQSIVYYVDRREYDGRSMKFLDNVDTSYFGGESFMNYWVKENRYANREPTRNAEITKGYKDGSIIQVKNPGSWTNVYLVTPDKFYVYKVTDKRTGKYYIGSKTTLDKDNYYIGYNYFTSSTDTEFVDDFKKNTTKYKHEVLKYFTDKQQCLDYEADLIEDAWNNDRSNLINRGYVKKSGTTHHVVSSNTNTPEVNAKRSKSVKETWANKSEEEMKAIADKISKKAKETWSSKSEEELKEIRARRASTSKETWSNKSEEERKRGPLSEETKVMISSTLTKYFEEHPKGSKYDKYNSKVTKVDISKEEQPKVISESERKTMLHPNYKNRKPRAKETYTDEWKQKVSEQTKIKSAEQKVKDVEYIHSMGYITVDDLLAMGWTYKQTRKLIPVGIYKKRRYFNPL